jgi:hypothetical protein
MLAVIATTMLSLSTEAALVVEAAVVIAGTGLVLVRLLKKK